MAEIDEREQHTLEPNDYYLTPQIHNRRWIKASVCARKTERFINTKKNKNKRGRLINISVSELNVGTQLMRLITNLFNFCLEIIAAYRDWTLFVWGWFLSKLPKFKCQNKRLCVLLSVWLEIKTLIWAQLVNKL